MQNAKGPRLTGPKLPVGNGTSPNFCFALAYFLAWYWQRKNKLLTLDFTPPLHWTERDQNAWKLVEARAKAGEKVPPDKLTEFQFYIDTAKDMAQELAAFYHPGASDP